MSIQSKHEEVIAMCDSNILALENFVQKCKGQIPEPVRHAIIMEDRRLRLIRHRRSVELEGGER